VLPRVTTVEWPSARLKSSFFPRGGGLTLGLLDIYLFPPPLIRRFAACLPSSGSTHTSCQAKLGWSIGQNSCITYDSTAMYPLWFMLCVRIRCGPKCPDCFSLVHGYVLGTAMWDIVPRAEVDLRHISRMAVISIPVLYLRNEYIRRLISGVVALFC
jgi:hypothetical protein